MHTYMHCQPFAITPVLLLLSTMLLLFWVTREAFSNDEEATPLYIVSLERRPQRRAQMLERIKPDARYRIALVCAVDGHALFGDKRESFISKPGEAGCFLSHLKMWQHFLQHGKGDYAVILEDDADIQFPKQWDTLVDASVSAAPPDWDLLWIGYDAVHYPERNTRVNERLTRNRSMLYGTHAYVIRKSAAQRLYDKYRHMQAYTQMSQFSSDRQIDIELSELPESELSQFLVNEDIAVRQRKEFSSDTYHVSVPD